MKRLLPLLLLTACPAEDGTDDPRVDDSASRPDTDPATEDLSGWSEPWEAELRVATEPPPEITLDLDRDDVADLFGPTAADIVMLELDPFPLLRNALDEIKAACGTDWQRDVSNPVYDCSLTALGQTFSGPDGTARTSPELALIRILTMTPANGDVTGTSVEGVGAIADFLGLGGGTDQILADTLGIARTEEFLDTEPVANAIYQDLLLTHPAMPASGLLPVTLEDALTDMATFGQRFGPSGNHPGVVDPGVPTFGEVLGPDFRMVAVVRSNLRVLDGLDLSQGKDWIGVVVDETGPTLDDEVEFDFDDPERFFVEGLTPEPRVDLRFGISEHVSFVPACVGVNNPNCRLNVPGSPRGQATVWRQAPWTMEHIIATAGAIKYGALRNTVSYLFDQVQIRVGRNGDPAGFARFDVLFDLGNPPGPQFVWELVNEVAQVRVHEVPGGSLAEGDVNPAFTLRDVAVGIDGDEAAEAVRPYLASQNDLISDFLLGNYRDNSGPVDLYWRTTSGGRAMLFYVGEGDLNGPYEHATPGFYEDAALTRKISFKSVPGVSDVTHEKWEPPAGDSVVYVADDEGGVYRLDVTAPSTFILGAPLTVAVRRRLP